MLVHIQITTLIYMYINIEGNDDGIKMSKTYIYLFDSGTNSINK